jgi:hypothetical protein
MPVSLFYLFAVLDILLDPLISFFLPLLAWLEVVSNLNESLSLSCLLWELIEFKGLFLFVCEDKTVWVLMSFFCVGLLLEMAEDWLDNYFLKIVLHIYSEAATEGRILRVTSLCVVFEH